MLEIQEYEKKKEIKRPFFEQNAAIQEKVKEIIKKVKEEGDLALEKLTLEYDGCKPFSLKIPPSSLKEAYLQMPEFWKKSCEKALENIKKVQMATLRKTQSLELEAGLWCSLRAVPLNPVGLYVPGGHSPLYSTLFMLGIPAMLAGCQRIILCTPPQKNGMVHPTILAAAYMVGLKEVFAVGGAQAIAAMAYGTTQIPKVQKIFGPGNIWVTEAKNQVSSQVAIDMPAGPSELMILADSKANPKFLACDFLSQLEHGENTQAILVSSDVNILLQTRKELFDIIKNEKIDYLKQNILNSQFILTKNLEESIRCANDYAPEHLSLAFEDGWSLVPLIQNAGSLFVGYFTCESLGDYFSGSNHVLPTYGWARSLSGLDASAFQKIQYAQSVSCEKLQEIGPYVIEMAEKENMKEHARSVKVRMEF